MNVQAEKIVLTKAILDIDSKVVLKHVKAVLSSYKTDLWDEMPDEIKASVKKGIKESEKGLGKPHEEVMKKYRKWLKK